MLDPAPVTQHLRSMYSSQLLIVAVNHFSVFEFLAEAPLSSEALREKLGLKKRPFMVLLPALLAMGFLKRQSDEKIAMTEQGQFLQKTKKPHLVDYVGLMGDDPGVLDLLEKLKQDGEKDKSEAVSYVKDEFSASPMDDPTIARQLTLALAGRAEYLAPLVAEKLPAQDGHFLDVAAGSGFFSFEYLKKNSKARATLIDRPAVLEVAKEFASSYETSVQERLTFLPGDMLEDELPKCDLLLAASLLHDWGEESCEHLTGKFANALDAGGEIWVHDAFLNDALDGPLAVCDYSAQLFCFTKGRCYSVKEHCDWFEAFGLELKEDRIPTLLDYALLSFRAK
jgi:hypothetical protein